MLQFSLLLDYSFQSNNIANLKQSYTQQSDQIWSKTEANKTILRILHQ